MSEEKTTKINSLEGNNQNGDSGEVLSFEERFKKNVERVSPYIKILWSVKKKLIFINLAVIILASAFLIFFVKNYYKSTVTILPDYGNKESSISQLSGLASLAGISVGQNSHTQIYQNLINSEVVLRPVIYSEYATEKYPDSVNLITYFKIKPDEDLPPALRKRKIFLEAFKQLQGDVATNIDRTTQILTVTVKMPEPQLSADVVNKAVMSLNHYVQTQRKSYASDQEKYIEKRIGQVKDSLNFAENALMKFNEQNRIIMQSPLLQLQQERLTRNVDILTGVYLELRKQLELAKIDEINDTPVVNVRDYAQDPVYKAGPRRSVYLIIIFLLSVVISCSYYMFNDNIKKINSFLGTTFKKNTA